MRKRWLRPFVLAVAILVVVTAPKLGAQLSRRFSDGWLKGNRLELTSSPSQITTTTTNANIQLLPNGTGITQIGDAGATSHTLNANDDLFVTGELEVDGPVFFDSTVAFLDFNSRWSISGSYLSCVMGPEADDSFHISPRDTDGAVNNNVAIVPYTYYASDFDHEALSTNPTLFVHSATNPDTNNTQWISLTHDQTNGVLDVGTGVVSIPDGISAGTDLLYTQKTIIKTVDLDDDASTDDYQFDDDAADQVEQVITLTNIIPAYAEMVSYQIRCFETVTGSTAVNSDFGTTSGGAEIYGPSAIDSANDISTTASGAAPELAATAAAQTLYFSATPGANWNTLDAGRWAIIITYNDYGAAYTFKNP